MKMWRRKKWSGKRGTGILENTAMEQSCQYFPQIQEVDGYG